jgi:hypothetical protein
MPKLGASLADELRYAAQDIRQTWEALWFGEAVTPANQLHHRDVSREDFERLFGERTGDAGINISMQQDVQVTLHQDIER